MRFVKRMIPLYAVCLAVVFCCGVLASGAVTVLSRVSAASEQGALPVIVLDPGHGGEDGGAVSPGGIQESALNLEISLRTRDLLAFLGFSVTMTRETDVSIYSPEAETVSEKKVSDLRNRVQLVNQTPGALLVSIHQNMFPEGKYHGAQVFYADTPGSEELANSLQTLLNTELDPSNHRQVKESVEIYLLNRVRCTGILVECGFLSNPEEERRLQSPDYQKLLAASIGAGLSRHLTEETAS